MIRIHAPCTKKWQSKRCKSTVEKGFTLLEMMIAIAIMSLLLSLTVVGMQQIIAKKQASTTLSSLRADVVFSRGEAIKRGGWVGLCGSVDGTSCSAKIQDGWLVYHDTNRDSVLDNTDIVLSWTPQEHNSLVVELEESGTSPSNTLMFNHRGYPDRSVLLRTSKGDYLTEMILHTTGSIVPK